MEGAGVVHGHDAAAARADLGDVDGGHAEQEARALVEPAPLRHDAADLELSRPRDRAGLDHRGLGRRAAHVDADGVGGADAARQRRRRDDARGRAGLDHVHGTPAPALRRHHPAVGLHHEHGGAGPEGANLVLEPSEVTVQHGHHVRIRDGRARALELAHLGKDLRRQRHAHAGRALPDDGADRPLVLAVRPRVEETDGDGFHALGQQTIDGLHDALAIQRRHHLAAVVHPLTHLSTPSPRHEGRRALEIQVVEPGEAEPADLQEIAKALGRDETRARAPALEDGVGGHGRTVDDLAHVGGRRPGVEEQRPRARDDGVGVVAGGGEQLARSRRAGGVDQHEIGEGPAHVHAEPVRHAVRLPPASPRGTNTTKIMITSPTAMRL